MAKKPSRTDRGLPAPRGDLLAPRKLVDDLRVLIEATRAGIAQAVNSALVRLYWEVGHPIRTEVLRSRRAAYGQEILSTASKESVAGHGNGFSVPSLSRMTRRAELFPDRDFVTALSRELGWSHFAEILPLKDQPWRAFSAVMCLVRDSGSTAGSLTPGAGHVVTPGCALPSAMVWRPDR